MIDRFGLTIKKSNFNLDLIRPVQPKSLNLNANANFHELLYLLNDQTGLSISYKEQLADTQFIDCYSFNNLTIGYCQEAQIRISNSKDKYKPLGDSSIMMINGSNKELKINLIKASNINFIDDYKFYIGISENSFDWITPIEEMTKGFFSNVKYEGTTIGELISREITRLPQRDEWLFFKLGINLQKDLQITTKLNLFYDFDIVFVDTKDYNVFNSINKFNTKITSGINYSPLKNITLSLSGTLYKNNLFGYEDISFSQRSEHHFNQAFGSINSSIKFSF